MGGFLPESYLIPRDLQELKRNFDKHKFWIVKPPSAARGIGIKVAHSWKQIPKKKYMIVSRYIDKPLLIQERKFDLRIYVLVPSVLPLTLFMFEEGIARFASCK